MKLSHKTMQLQEMIAPAVAACGVKLWGLDFMPQGKRSMLRVYIDVADTVEGEDISEDGGKGVGVESCVQVSQQVGALLDVHNPISGEYTLEVSSPGWDRQFYAVEQMHPYVNQIVALRLINAVDGRRKMQGVLQSVSDQRITVLVDQTSYEVDVNNIDKANLVYQDS